MASKFTIKQSAWATNCTVDFDYNFFFFKWYVANNNVPKYDSNFPSGALITELFTDINGNLYDSADLYISRADALTIFFNGYENLELEVKNSTLFYVADKDFSTNFVYYGDSKINDTLIIKVDGRTFYIYCHQDTV